MGQASEELHHDRVLLRRWREDQDEVLDRLVLASLEHLRPWMPWASAHSLAEARRYLAQVQRDWLTGAAYNYAIHEQDRGEAGPPLGSCALMLRIGEGGMEIGYWIRPDRTGRGLVTMAVAALTREAFRFPDTTHVEVHHDAGNLRSAAVPRRLGFAEHARIEDDERVAPADTGVTVVQRLDRADAERLGLA